MVGIDDGPLVPAGASMSRYLSGITRSRSAFFDSWLFAPNAPVSGSGPAVPTGVAAGLSVPAGLELAGKTRVGSNRVLYFEKLSGRVFRGNRYVTTYGLKAIGRAAGQGSFAVSVLGDLYYYSKGEISLGKGILDTSVLGGALLLGGSVGVGIAFAYGITDFGTQLHEENHSLMEDWCRANTGSCAP
jgi:hypothetical protein